MGHLDQAFFFNIFVKTQLRQNSQNFKTQPNFSLKLKIFVQNSNFRQHRYYFADFFSHVNSFKNCILLLQKLFFVKLISTFIQIVKTQAQNPKTQHQNFKTQSENFKTQNLKLKTQFSGNSSCLRGRITVEKKSLT